MPVTENVLDLGAPLRILGGLRYPYPQRVVVDASGKGDYTTLALALAYVNTVATISNPYIVELIIPNATVVTVGDFTLNAGVWLKGQGRQQTFIQGTPTMLGGSRIIDLRWTPTAGSSTIMHFQNDLTGHRGVLDHAYGYLEKDQNAPIYGVHCTGSTAGALGLEFIGCKLYLANRQASAPSAQMYMFHCDTGTNTYIHFHGGVLKTSSGATGSATSPELIWNQGQGVDAYVEITDSVWQAFYSLTPRRLRSENTSHVGADLSMRFRFKGATVASDIVAFAGATETDLYDGHFGDVRAVNLRMAASGRVLTVAPSGRRDYTTIGAAIAAATAMTPASGSRWLIDVMPGIYAEVLDVPSYVTLRLPGNLATVSGGSGTTPTIILRGRAVLLGGNITSAGQVCVRIVGDVVGGVPKIFGSDITATATVDGVVTAVEITGSSFSGAFAHVTHCGTIYARNTSLGASAKAVIYRLTAGGPALEAYGCHHKLSAGEDGTADLRLAWNESADAYAQLNVTGDVAVYNGADYYDLYSTNAAAAHGGRIFCPTTGWVDEYGTPNLNVPTVKTYDVGANATSNHYRLKLLSVDITAAPYTSPVRIAGRALWADADGRLRYRTDTTAPPTADAGILLGGVPNVRNTGSRYTATFNPTGKTTATLTVNTSSAVRFDITSLRTFAEIGVDCTTAGTAGALARFMIFSNDPTTGRPGVMVLDAGTTAATATGYLSKVISWSPAPGRYWVVVAAEGATISIRACQGADSEVPQTTNNANTRNGYVGTHSAGIAVGGAFVYSAETGTVAFMLLAT